MICLVGMLLILFSLIFYIYGQIPLSESSYECPMNNTTINDKITRNFIIMRTSIMDFGKRDFLNWIISATTPLKIRQTISYLQVWKVKYTFQNQPFVGPVTGLIYSRCRIAGLRLVCPMYTLPSGKVYL